MSFVYRLLPLFWALPFGLAPVVASNAQTLSAPGFSLKLVPEWSFHEASWNTASDITGTNTPNVLSELDFEKQQGYGLRLQAELQRDFLHGHVLFGAELRGGRIVTGRTRDSDYLGDNRTQEFSRSRSDIVGDRIRDWKLYTGLGASHWDFLSVSLMLGYQQQQQTMRFQNGEQLLCNSPCTTALGSFSGLDSRYSMTWSSPWVGARLSQQEGRHRLDVQSILYFASQYRGEAEWNLRTDLKQPKSFEHEADAFGQSWQLDYSYQLTRSFSFTLSAQHTRWQSRDGEETRYFANNTVGKTRLNEATSRSTYLGVGLQWRLD